MSRFSKIAFVIIITMASIIGVAIGSLLESLFSADDVLMRRIVYAAAWIIGIPLSIVIMNMVEQIVAKDS